MDDKRFRNIVLRNSGFQSSSNILCSKTLGIYELLRCMQEPVFVDKNLMSMWNL